MEENLSKWLNGDISDDELKKLIGTEEALKYIQILGEVDNWVPDNSERLIDPKEITSRPKGKVRTMRPWYSYAAAAVVFLAVVAYLWVQVSDATVTHSSLAGEIREIELPDGSKVTLAPNSEISWESDKWEEVVAYQENRLKSKKVRRKVKLKGKALLKVAKGAPFSVESPTGTVDVLGTIFEVDDFNEGMSVVCYEGKVQAKPKTLRKTVTLTRGDGYLFFNGKWEKKENTTESGPAWLQNQTKFENAPLSQVIKTLEKVYGVAITTGKIDIAKRFTGTIPNDKLEVALRLVFSPYKISFKRDGKAVTLTQEN